jgi:hypothetical protein
MTIRELMEKLSESHPDSVVYVKHEGDDGCDTCGYGRSTYEDTPRVYDLAENKGEKGKVWIEWW